MPLTMNSGTYYQQMASGGKRSPSTRPPASASGGGCLRRIVMWGGGLLAVLVGLSVLGNLAPRTPAEQRSGDAPITVAPLVVATATPQPTMTPEPTMTAAPAATSEPTAAAGPVAIEAAHVREGPGAEYASVIAAQPGQPLVVSGRDASGLWLQLASGYWIEAALVANAPANLPVVTAPAPAVIQEVPTPEPIVVTPEPVAPVVQEAPASVFVCTGGCAIAPDPSCAIKGNVNSQGSLIYHVPGWRDYERTDVKPEEGDRWFCTEAEAIAAGFRAPLNH